MERHGGGHGAVRVLVALIALLLPAGALAATSIDAGEPASQPGRVGAAGFAQEALVDEEASPDRAVQVSTTVALPPPPSLTVSTLPSVPKPPPALPGLPPTTAPPVASSPPPNLPPLPPPPTIKPLPPASKWSKTANGVSVRMHIEPASPVAGQPVTFVIDELTAPAACCIIHLSPGLGTTVPLATTCGDAASRAGLSYTHTYPEAGVHAFLLMVLTTSCPDGTGRAEQKIGLDLRGCITVGPDAARAKKTVPPICGG
jgi:hypothetical protein